MCQDLLNLVCLCVEVCQTCGLFSPVGGYLFLAMIKISLVRDICEIRDLCEGRLELSTVLAVLVLKEKGGCLAHERAQRARSRYRSSLTQ